MMRTLFIIGNGFDCYGHKLPTQYDDFKQYLIKRFPNYNKDFSGIIESTIMPDGEIVYNMDDLVGSIISLLNDCAGKDWRFLEQVIGNEYAESLLEQNEWYFSEVDNWDNDSDDKEIRHAIYNNEDLSHSIMNAYIQLRQLFEEWVFKELTKINYSNCKKIKKPSFRNSIFLNFNYTSTLEDLYHVNAKDIFHFHGYARDMHSEIIFGHGDEEELTVPDMFFGAQEGFDELIGYMKKDTDRVISTNKEFFKKINKVKKIYSYGFSFSDVDMCYIEEITRLLKPKKVRWYFNTYDWNNNQENIQKVRNMGYRIRRCYRW